MLSDLGHRSALRPQQAHARPGRQPHRRRSPSATSQTDDGTLSARVTVINRVGHKFPSGVGFRRAFVEFSVLDANNKVLWASGRTNGAGVIVDEQRHADRRRAVVEARLLGAHRSRCAPSTSRTTR